MNSSNQIDQFLEELSVVDFDKFQIISGLRNIVLQMFPKVTETFKYGGILFSLNEDFGGLFASKNHVSFEFSYGYKLTSNAKLEGTGKYRRHIKVQYLDKVLEEDIRDLLRQIQAIDHQG